MLLTVPGPDDQIVPNFILRFDLAVGLDCSSAQVDAQSEIMFLKLIAGASLQDGEWYIQGWRTAA